MSQKKIYDLFVLSGPLETGQCLCTGVTSVDTTRDAALQGYQAAEKSHDLFKARHGQNFQNVHV